MESPKRTVLITGCSDGGLGSALAVAFHKAGLHVYATARNRSKMSELVALGIETHTLDVLSDSSIADCVSKIPNLDILVNNAGAMYAMPVSDLSIPEAKQLFDLNVWSYLAVTQAFLPLLLKSKGMIVNQTSIASVCTVPFQAAYNASKAAMALFSDSQRLELEPFSIKVVDLKTGAVKSKIFTNHKEATQVSLPKGSIYEPARETIESRMDGSYSDGAVPADQWAEEVVRSLLKKTPPLKIWAGGEAWAVWFSTLWPYGTFDGIIKKVSGVGVLVKALQT